jgi:uncharacterized protein YdaU (DUF1376 family)
MAKAPAFQFYANDFMDATRFWDANAVGLYIRCMCIQWTQGAIPADLKVLARGLGCDLAELEGAWPTLSEKFVDVGGGMLQNQRLEASRVKVGGISAKRSEAANARWSKDANADANAHTKKVQRKMKIEDEVEDVIEERVTTHEVEIVWPTWAGEQTRAKWEEFKAYRKGSHKFTYKTPGSEQAAVNLLAKYYKSGKEAFDGIDLAMAKGWKFPVDPAELSRNAKPNPLMANPHTTGKRADLKTTWD